jgi:pimeloyl-ACP methyl ester carboxylesterase
MEERHMQRIHVTLVLIAVLLSLGQSIFAQSQKPADDRVAQSRDSVQIRYWVAGHGEPALVLIHGGFADRTYWTNEITAFSNERLVIALDLAGHGQSGVNRKAWSMQAFGEDVCAVLDKEKVRKAVLVGNSLGGPVALEAARLARGRVLGVIGIDTFHDFTEVAPPSYYDERAKAFREDYSGAMKQMVQMLFHKDADPALIADVERKMLISPGREFAGAIMESFKGYDEGLVAKGADVPIRAINGDLFPTEVLKNRALGLDFQAVILPHTGHYPMLENPALFNRVLAGFLTEWPKPR